MTRQELGLRIRQVAHLTGHFVLRSGQTSNEYFDKYRFEAAPSLLSEIASHMAALVPSTAQVLAGLELGGVPVATALSLKTSLPCAFVRKRAKDYGTMKLAEGAAIVSQRVLVVEDVVTTGGQVLDSVQDLRKLGADVTDVICVILRNEDAREKFKNANLNLRCLFTMTELKSFN